MESIRYLQSDDLELAQLGCLILQQMPRELWSVYLAAHLNPKFSWLIIDDQIKIRWKEIGIYEQIEMKSMHTYEMKSLDTLTKAIQDFEKGKDNTTPGE